jgi:hypothetical protein
MNDIVNNAQIKAPAFRKASKELQLAVLQRVEYLVMQASENNLQKLKSKQEQSTNLMNLAWKQLEGSDWNTAKKLDLPGVIGLIGKIIQDVLAVKQQYAAVLTEDDNALLNKLMTTCE